MFRLWEILIFFVILCGLGIFLCVNASYGSAPADMTALQPVILKQLRSTR